MLQSRHNRLDGREPSGTVSRSAAMVGFGRLAALGGILPGRMSFPFGFVRTRKIHIAAKECGRSRGKGPAADREPGGEG
jgi:hypothetical protein